MKRIAIEWIPFTVAESDTCDMIFVFTSMPLSNCKLTGKEASSLLSVDRINRWCRLFLQSVTLPHRE